MVRETPFHLGHLRNMTALAEMGAIIAPPIPGFLPPPANRDGSGGPQRGPRARSARPARCRRFAAGKEPRNETPAHRAARAVAFQGERGAFSEQAARQLLGPRAPVLPCARFEDVFRSLKEGRAAGAVVPIENTLAGSVHENYDHLLHFDLPIVAETSVRIVHNLIAAQRRGLPQDQARIFASGGAQPVPGFFPAQPANRANSVLRYRRQREDACRGGAHGRRRDRLRGGRGNLRGAHFAQIDRKRPAEFHPVLPAAHARVCPAPSPRRAIRAAWKTSVVFSTRNIPGALFRALSAFALRDLNLTKIESRPLRGKPCEYLFYLDFLGRVDHPHSRNALAPPGGNGRLPARAGLLSQGGLRRATSGRRAEPVASPVPLRHTESATCRISVRAGRSCRPMLFSAISAGSRKGTSPRRLRKCESRR